MTSDRCSENKAKGYAFCPQCGEDLIRFECTSCETHREMGDRFCSECGREINPLPKKSTFSKITDVCGAIITSILVCYIIIESMTAIWGVPIVWDHLPSYTHSIFIVIPRIVSLFEFSGPAVQVYYLLILAGVLASVCYLIKKSYGPLKEEGIEGLKKTPMYETFALFAALMFVEFTYILVLPLFGVKTTNPFEDEEVWEMMFTLLNASIYEEFVCRILYIGVPMAIIALISRKEGTKWYRCLFGGFGVNKVALIFILFSSALFAFGHLGWGWWKIFPTFLFGLISGYIFCKYGVYATICMHFLTDYMSASEWLGGEPISMMTALAVVLGSCILGIPLAISYTKRAFLWVKDEFFSPKQF